MAFLMVKQCTEHTHLQHTQKSVISVLQKDTQQHCAPFKMSPLLHEG